MPPFDKARVLGEVHEILRGMRMPGTGRSVIGAGLVTRVSADDGQVVVVLSPGEETPEAAVEAVKTSLRPALESVSGVDSVDIIERSPADAAHPGPRPIPGVRDVVAIAGGKGGIGRSTVAVNVASVLAAEGRRVGLLDADVADPAVSLLAGARARPALESSDSILPVEIHGIRTISMGALLDGESPVAWRESLAAGIVRQFLFQVRWGDLDLLLIDLPPGMGEAHLAVLRSVALRGAVIVTTPQILAIEGMRRTIAMLRRFGIAPIGVVENMSGYVCPSCGHREAIFASGGARRAAEEFGVPSIGEIPIDPAIRRLGDAGRPVPVAEPGSASSHAFRRIAEAITRACGRSPAPSP
ncbi:MAG: P-loop NTPase [Planctomycetes bacterium]|nr:P-loop NTPase [Planctomycetota bacterium]